MEDESHSHHSITNTSPGCSAWTCLILLLTIRSLLPVCLYKFLQCGSWAPPLWGFLHRSNQWVMFDLFLRSVITSAQGLRADLQRLKHGLVPGAELVHNSPGWDRKSDRFSLLHITGLPKLRVLVSSAFSFLSISLSLFTSFSIFRLCPFFSCGVYIFHVLFYFGCVSPTFLFPLIFSSLFICRSLSPQNQTE